MNCSHEAFLGLKRDYTSMTLPGRRLRPEMLTSEEALEQAKAYARAVRER
jgi:hypothetical protein